MKINPLEGTHSPQRPTAIDRNTAGRDPFQCILDRTLEQKEGGRVAAPAVAPMLNAAPVTPIDFDSTACRSMERVLDALERYRHLLADTQANLRAVEPALKQVKAEADSLNALLPDLEAGDPLEPVLRETLVLAAKEVTRFEQGDYADR